jgi:asparaginyl-tRNA synthetase
MSRTLVKDALNATAPTDAIFLQGWVRTRRDSKAFSFLHTPEFLREVAHLRPRTNLIGAVTRVRNTLAQAVHRFFHENGFFWVHTPIITASDCEGAGQMFRVSTLDMANLPRTQEGKVDFDQDFFGARPPDGLRPAQRRVLLPGAEQGLHLRPDLPRRELQHRRHLAEFWMIEPEIAFAICTTTPPRRAFLKYLFKAVLDERGDDLAFFAERVDKDLHRAPEGFVEAKFERMTYTEAIEALEKSGQEVRVPGPWGMDLQSEHERFLTEEHFGRPVVVMNYPKEIKAFYMRSTTTTAPSPPWTCWPRHRRDHRRQPARGAPRRARCAASPTSA